MLGILLGLLAGVAEVGCVPDQVDQNDKTCERRTAARQDLVEVEEGCCSEERGGGICEILD